MTMATGEVKPFLAKLWKILEEESLSDLICWDESGASFHIFNPYEFSRVVLSRFFKTTAISSFVRQLNIYGFKKHSDRLVDQISSADHMEFSHPFFRRGHWEMLCHIARRPPSTKKQQVGKAPIAISDYHGDQNGKSGDAVMVAEGDLANLLDELQNLRVSQSSMQDTIAELSKDKEVLWNEVNLLRNSHMKQQQNVSRLVQFLLSLMQPSSTNHHHHTKHHRMGAGVNGQPKAKILVPVEEENPLALVGSSNWDVLGAIQSDIMMEELDFMHCSNMLPSALENSMGTLGSGSANTCGPLVADDLFAPRSGYEISNVDQTLCARPMDHRAVYKVASASPFGLGSSSKVSRHSQRSSVGNINAQPSSSFSSRSNWAIVQREPSCKELVPSYHEYNFTQPHPYAESMPPSISNVMGDDDDTSIHSLDYYIHSDKGDTNTDVDLTMFGGDHEHGQHSGEQYNGVEEVIDDGVQLEEISTDCHSSDFMIE